MKHILGCVVTLGIKLTRRIRKILLFLLHPENASKWFEKRKISFGERDYYGDWQIMSFCEHKPWYGFTRSEWVSHQRTFRILETLGFVERMQGYLPSYRLTSKGREVAEKIEKETRNLIVEYKDFIKWRK